MVGCVNPFIFIEINSYEYSEEFLFGRKCSITFANYYVLLVVRHCIVSGVMASIFSETRTS